MQRFFWIAVLITSVLCVSQSSAQFTIKVPKVKVEKPKQDKPKTGESGVVRDQPTSGQPRAANSGSNVVYPSVKFPSTPAFIKHSVYVQARMASTYWKMPKQSDYTSWVPTVRFGIFYDWKKEVSYAAEYYNPDGSLWFSETLESRNRDADGTTSFQSPWGLETVQAKGGVAAGIYSVKIMRKDTNETVFQGKFKVGKFLRPYSERTPNRFAFYVEHDWVMPMAYVGFHFSNFNNFGDNIGGFPVEVSTWIKGEPDPSDLEARLFYKGQQIATDKEGSTDGHYWAERMAEFSNLAPDPHVWKVWNFQWENFRFDNGGSFNHDLYPNAHYADKNPGEYTVKVYRKGTEVREIKFTVQPDGKLQDQFAGQIFLPYYKIIVPVKIVGTTEKWNTNAWKTDAFYGNPMTGFTIQ
jgi:hypothetical protein